MFSSVLDRIEPKTTMKWAYGLNPLFPLGFADAHLDKILPAGLIGC